LLIGPVELRIVFMTPAEFQDRYGVDAKRLRGYLRERWPHEKHDRWVLNREMVEDACQRFGLPTHSETHASRVQFDEDSTNQRRETSGTRQRPTRGVQGGASALGLHIPLLAEARAAGIPLLLGRPVPWLSGRGHMTDLVRRTVGSSVLGTLAMVHQELGGDARILETKVRRNPPTPDLVHEQFGCIIEVDEVQHFTTARARSFDFYSAQVVLGFNLDEYIELIRRWRSKGDRAFAHKKAADFPNVGGRQAQRAYNDTLRDLLAPYFTGHPIIRIPLPDRSMRGALDRLRQALEGLNT
jgi:hypothetical protein